MLGGSLKRFLRILRSAKSERTEYEEKRAQLLARAKMLDEAKKDYDEARQTYRHLQKTTGFGDARDVNSPDQNRDAQ